MYDTLIIGSGGNKAYYYLGFLYVLMNKDYYHNIERFVGVSVGSIISLLLICNYNIMEILENFIDINIIDINNININNLFTKFALFNKEAIFNKLISMIKDKFGKRLTLDQLHKSTGKTLCIVTTDYTNKKEQIIDKDSFPDMDCVEAVMKSIIIPGIFPYEEYKGNIYIDGVLSMAYPSILFDNGTSDILCVHVSYSNNSNTNNENILDYLSNSFDIMINQIKNIAIKNKTDRCKIVLIPCDISDILGINSSIDNKSKMFLTGYNTAQSNL